MKAKVISVINQKGGVGKTTVCYHLSYALKELGHTVLCLDLDPQANLSFLFGLSQDDDYHGIFSLLINSIKELKHLHQGIFLNEVLHEKAGVDLLPASQDLSGFDLTVSAIHFPRQLILKKFLEKSDLLNKYDYIIIDAPPTLGLLVINILCACQNIIMPFKADDFSYQGVKQFHQVLENVKEMGIVEVPSVSYYVPNLIDLRRKKEEEALCKFKERYGEKIFDCINSSALFLKAQSEKKSIFEYHSKDYLKWQLVFKELAIGLS